MLDAPFFQSDLAARDPEIAAAIAAELGRQRHEVELIASENIVSRAVLEAQGSVMTNKYAEGYPGRRYYAAAARDVSETLGQERAKRLFGLRPRQRPAELGSQATRGLQALLKPGDTSWA
jgi:glycine hydroxymethyltransferase